jgi:hypothetical protein
MRQGVRCPRFPHTAQDAGGMCLQLAHADGLRRRTSSPSSRRTVVPHVTTLSLSDPTVKLGADRTSSCRHDREAETGGGATEHAVT